MEWVLLSNTLCLAGGKENLFPLAKDIYPLLTQEKTEIVFQGVVLRSPILKIPSLRFSSIGSNLKAILESRDGLIYLKFCAQKKNKEFPLFMKNGRIIDHFIDDNKWYFVAGNIVEIEETLQDAGILDSGEISIAQYLDLKKAELLGLKKFFEDRVEVEQLRTRHFSSDLSASLPLKATLFEYQKVGVNWIKSILDNTHGCILGDEMGLGKTLQMIAYSLSICQNENRSILAIAPISLLANWEKECHKFAPSLNVCVHHGLQRTGNYKDLLSYDLIVTSYSTVVNDIHMLNMIQWDLVILDEAQNIKNPASSRAIACKSLGRKNSVAVTGTPFENHVTDVWSIVDFVCPGLLGSLSKFEALVTDDIQGGKKLEPILSSLMIRRLVKNVAQELPPRIDINQPLQMSEKECSEYISCLNSLKERAQTEEVSLAMIQPLRMFCTHPALENGSECDNPYSSSVKYQRLCEILENIIESREKVIIFTSYKKMFDIFEHDLPSRFGVRLWTINGETVVSERQQIVDVFNSHPLPAILVLNPRAAGTGLNITGANHVVHYNLEWNPALEDQSSARAYRKGQEKTVFVYRLFYANTVEQVIQERILRKRNIADVAVVGSTGEDSEATDVFAALNMVPSFN